MPKSLPQTLNRLRDRMNRRQNNALWRGPPSVLNLAFMAETPPLGTPSAPLIREILQELQTLESTLNCQRDFAP